MAKSETDSTGDVGGDGSAGKPAFPVPQVFHDILGRILPGVAILVAWLVATLKPATQLVLLKALFLPPEEASPSWLLVLFLGGAVSFSVGALAGSLYFLPTGPLHWLCVKRGWQWRPTLLLTDGMSEAYDRIRLENKHAGLRISRLNADLMMYRALAVGFGTAVALSALRLCVDPFAVRALETGFLAAGLLGALSALLTIHCLVRDRAIKHYAAALGIKIKKAEEDEAGEGEAH